MFFYLINFHRFLYKYNVYFKYVIYLTRLKHVKNMLKISVSFVKIIAKNVSKMQKCKIINLIKKYFYYLIIYIQI